MFPDISRSNGAETKTRSEAVLEAGGMENPAGRAKTGRPTVQPANSGVVFFVLDSFFCPRGQKKRLMCPARCVRALARNGAGM